MEKHPSITPEMVPETNEEKKFLSVGGVERYSHLMSSFTNIMLGLFLFLSAGALFDFQLIDIIYQARANDPGQLVLFLLFALPLAVLLLMQMLVAIFGGFTSLDLRKEVKAEVEQAKLASRAKLQALLALILFVMTSVIFVGTLAMYVTINIVNAVTPAGVALTKAPELFTIILAALNTFVAFSYLYIAKKHIRAITLGPDYYNATSVQPVGRLEFVYIGVGNFLISVAKQALSFLMLFVKAFLNIFVGLYKIIKNGAIKVWKFIVNYFKTFKNHSYRTKLSYFFMGSGHAFMRRPFKTIMYMILQIGYIVYMVLPTGGLYWLSKFDNLGDRAFTTVDECAIIGISVENCLPEDIIQRTVFLDNSMLITLYSVATIIITVAFFVLYWLSIRGVVKADEIYTEARDRYENDLLADEQTLVNPSDSALEINDNEKVTTKHRLNEFDSNIENEMMAQTEQSGPGQTSAIPILRPRKFVNPLPTFIQELKTLFNERFHITTLTVPTITITIFTVLPLVFMILLAFTNYSGQVGPPNSLFKWVGLQTFTRLFSSVGGSSFSKAFADIIQWTFVWAFFATFSNYILGMILAMIINRRGLKLKKLWRTVFVITIAVPQFVTLLLMSRLLNKYGPINQTLLDLGWITNYIEFLTDPLNAKISVILVNVWVGVPYTMLITSGILMNIPADLYESARIDGAGPFSQFTKITLPYMLFVTGPYLITQFIGNINNFNVIFFLTAGGPSAQLAGVQYGKTDILVTWLYSLTVGGAQQEYAIGSALGIFIFAISAFITLALYAKTSAATQEGDFA